MSIFSEAEGPNTKFNRSAITNHRDMLPGIDGRSAGARRYRDLVLEIVADQGGVEHCATARLQLIRRFAAASVIAEGLEAALVEAHRHRRSCATLLLAGAPCPTHRHQSATEERDTSPARLFGGACDGGRG